MSGTTLEYGVQDKRKIKLQDGTLDNISQKNSIGFHISVVDRFDLNLKLRHPSIVYLIEVASIFAPKIIFQLYSLQDHLLETVIKDFQPNAIELIVFSKSRNSKLVTSKVKVIICNVEGELNPCIFSLRYLLIKGDKLQPSKASKRDITKKPEFTDARLSPHSLALKTKESGAVFSERKKNKEKEKPELDEDSMNLRKAIEMSKKQAEKKEETVVQMKNEKGSIWMQPKEERARDYDLVDFDKVKQFYTQVNSSWLEAQKKIEKERGVKENQRLSKYIHVKHFNGKNICVDLVQPKKDQIQKMAEEMGAKIQKEVVDNCYLISTRKDTERVARAKKLKNVKVLTPKFIQQCKQCDALLNEREYYLQL